MRGECVAAIAADIAEIMASAIMAVMLVILRFISVFLSSSGRFGSPQPWRIGKVHVIYACSGKLDSTLSIVIG